MNSEQKRCSFCDRPYEQREAELSSEIGRLNMANHELEMSLQSTLAASPPEKDNTRIERAIEIALQYSGFDGDFHKTWVIDQMLRCLAGSKYEDLIEEYEAGEDGPKTYEWETGYAP